MRARRASARCGKAWNQVRHKLERRATAPAPPPQRPRRSHKLAAALTHTHGPRAAPAVPLWRPAHRPLRACQAAYRGQGPRGRRQSAQQGCCGPAHRCGLCSAAQRRQQLMHCTPLGALAISIASPTDLVKVRMQAEGKLPAGCAIGARSALVSAGLTASAPQHASQIPLRVRSLLHHRPARGREGPVDGRGPQHQPQRYHQRSRARLLRPGALWAMQRGALRMLTHAMLR